MRNLKILSFTLLLSVSLTGVANATTWQLQNSDTFNRSNRELIGDTMSDGSGVWASRDNVTGVHSVTSNQYFSGAGSWNNVPVYNTTMSSTQGDQASEVTYKGSTNGGPVVRYASGAYYYLNVSGSSFTIYYATTGYPGTVVGTVSETTATGDVVRLEAVGTTLTAYENGVSKLSVTDSNLSTGRSGIWLAFSAYYDDYNDYIPQVTPPAPSTRRKSPSPMLIGL